MVMKLQLDLLGIACASQLISDISMKYRNLMSGKIFLRVVAEPNLKQSTMHFDDFNFIFL